MRRIRQHTAWPAGGRERAADESATSAHQLPAHQKTATMTATPAISPKPAKVRLTLTEDEAAELDGFLAQPFHDYVPARSWDIIKGVRERLSSKLASMEGRS